MFPASVLQNGEAVCYRGNRSLHSQHAPAAERPPQGAAAGGSAAGWSSRQTDSSQEVRPETTPRNHLSLSVCLSARLSVFPVLHLPFSLCLSSLCLCFWSMCLCRSAVCRLGGGCGKSGRRIKRHFPRCHRLPPLGSTPHWPLRCRLLACELK